MRTLGLLFVLCALLAAPLAAHAQETEPPDGTTITSAQVSGLDLSRLSPGLQQEIGKLTGTPLNRQLLRDLAARIEAEQPKFVAALRVVSDPAAGGGARVAFVVGRMREPEQANINTKYLVEEAEIRGVPDSKITPELRADLQALTGKPLDADEAERFETRLRAAFPEYVVSRRSMRGSERGRIRLVFQLERGEWSRWLRFEPMELNALYHSDQGWGAKLPLTISGRDFSVWPFLAWDVADDLVEEYSGFGIRFDSRKVGTERLGILFEWSTYDQEWRDPTLAALAANPQIPAPYRNRMTVTPLARFAITRQLTVGGGVTIAELDALPEDSPVSQMANAVVGSLRFNQRWKRSSGAEHELAALFDARAGTESLESDLVYERYFGRADYLYRWAKHRVLVSGQFGGITGEAPLFERFSLGDSRTLRGWDKYDITPAGGDRLFYTSVEYRYRVLALFLDAGSVWDTGAETRTRFATGFGFTPGPAFFLVGFPLNTDEFRAVFTMGVRFGSSTVNIQKQ